MCCKVKNKNTQTLAVSDQLQEKGFAHVVSQGHGSAFIYSGDGMGVLASLTYIWENSIFTFDLLWTL